MIPVHPNCFMFTGAKGKPIASTYLQVTPLNMPSPPDLGSTLYGCDAQGFSWNLQYGKSSLWLFLRLGNLFSLK